MITHGQWLHIYNDYTFTLGAKPNLCMWQTTCKSILIICKNIGLIMVANSNEKNCTLEYEDKKSTVL